MSKNLEMDEPRPSIGSMLSDLNLPSSNSNPSNTSLQKRLTPIGQVEQDLEYIFTPVNPFYGESGGFVPSRGWSDDLCYGTGTAYVSGLAFGGAWGFLQGLSVPLDIPSNKLRINAILNAMSRRGPFVANSFGVLGNILYTPSLINT
ncbi:Mitochondrial import inner membrane translocase subunit tim23 [Coelomomyces lativittatus]|nr:Mitochondrial import inner membrane translocase subunit tim23 [Coelomomyces lativittatus]